MGSKKHAVFVYGTLRRGEESHYLLENAECLASNAWTNGILYDTCEGYPAMYRGEGKVHGELYIVSEQQFVTLDAMEGFNSELPEAENEYIRVKQDVYTEQGIISAYMYIYNRAVHGGMRPIPSGNWLTRADGDYCAVDYDRQTEKSRYAKYYESEYEELTKKRKFMLRFLGATVIIFMFFTILSPWYGILHLPSIDLLTKSRELAEDPTIEEWMEPVVIVTTPGGKGTGFNIAAEGLIVTNQHVIDQAKPISITFYDGKIYTGTVVAEYPEIDLALVEINGRDLPVASLASLAELDSRNNTIIIGNPLGLSRIVTEGKVLGLVQLADWEHPVLALESPILQGNSGSPVFNHNGDVVAVIFANTGTTASDSADNIIGLAIPIDYLLDKDALVDMGGVNN